MRQKTMLSIKVYKEFATDLEEYKILTTTAFRLSGNMWPPDEPEPQEVDPWDYAVEEEDEPADEDEIKTVDHALYKDTTVAKLAATYELEREGQRRFWIKQDPNNSCYASFKGTT